LRTLELRTRVLRPWVGADFVSPVRVQRRCLHGVARAVGLSRESGCVGGSHQHNCLETGVKMHLDEQGSEVILTSRKSEVARKVQSTYLLGYFSTGGRYCSRQDKKRHVSKDKSHIINFPPHIDGSVGSYSLPPRRCIQNVPRRSMTCHAFPSCGSVFSAIHVRRHDALRLLAICSAEVKKDFPSPARREAKWTWAALTG
jgi:hypothetical protein